MWSATASSGCATSSRALTDKARRRVPGIVRVTIVLLTEGLVLTYVATGQHVAALIAATRPGIASL